MIDFRKVYRELSDSEKALINSIKATAEHLDSLYEQLPTAQGRYVAVARTHLETSVMYAVKAGT